MVWVLGRAEKTLYINFAKENEIGVKKEGC